MADADLQPEDQQAAREATDTLSAQSVWRGRDPEFASAVASELGILLDAERAVMVITRTGQSVMRYSVQDDSTALTIVSGTAHVEVTLTVDGPVGRAMPLTGAPAQRVMGHCAALVNRIQARWCAGEVGDD